MGSNAAAHAALEAFIRGVESLRTMNEQVAAAAAEDVGDVVRANVDAGVAPDGTPWAPKKDGGGKALAGKSDGVEAEAKGSAINVKIGPPLVFHNWGAGGSSTTKAAASARKRARARQAASGTKSKFHAPQRQILPSSGEIPEQMRKVITEHAKKVFGKATGGS